MQYDVALHIIVSIKCDHTIKFDEIIAHNVAQVEYGLPYVIIIIIIIFHSLILISILPKGLIRTIYNLQ